MKKFLSTTFSFLLACVITYAGSGINAYSFCCDDCHTFGIEAIVGHKCSDVHEHECINEQADEVSAICEETHQQCELNRLDLDLENISIDNGQSFIKLSVLKPNFITTLHNLIQNLQKEPIIGYISETQIPPNLSKTSYFSLLETLII